MAYVVKGRGESWELRQSVHTADGPRSKTLATFSTLTSDAIERALSRSTAPLTAEQIEHAARRAGAPVALSQADRAARELLDELAHGRRPRGVIGRLLEERLATFAGETRPTPAQQSAAEWAGSTVADRAAALVDLLLLADALPAPSRPRRKRFPRLEALSP
ncbi:MAG: hypothetical protein HZB14_04375 [Actinobacteria bacterium]|nr:hypothetical protein [Actinomycetota bacterium]